MTKTRTAVAMLLGLALLAGAAGCSSGTEEPTTPPASEQPPATGGAPEGEGPAPQATDEGRQLVEEKCSRCHSLDRVEQAQKAGDEWGATVDRMIGNGLQVTDEEQQAIVEYLTARDAER